MVAFGLSFALPTYWRSTASVVADSNDPTRSLGGLAGLAAQFGAPVASSAQNPQYFADLLRTRAVLARVLHRQAPTATRGDSAPVIDQLMRDAGGTSPLREERAVRELRESVQVAVGPRTGVIEISATTRSPALSMHLVEALVEELDVYNRQTRSAKARERRVFTESRLREASDSLAAAERALEAFSSANRSFQGSPMLELTFARLQRQASAQSELVTTLRKQYETSRLDEVNDTPVLSVIDAPVLPVVRAAPSRRNMAIAGFALGCVAAAAAAAASTWRAARNHPHAPRRAGAGFTPEFSS